MDWLALTTSLTLVGLAVVHVLWAFEVWWPIRDERKLVATVIGVAEVTRMPGAIPCGLVAAFLTVLAVLIWLPEMWLRDWGLLMSAVVLLGRGALAYVPRWRAMTPQEPFAQNDRRAYGPLCIALGASLLMLGGWFG